MSEPTPEVKPDVKLKIQAKPVVVNPKSKPAGNLYRPGTRHEMPDGTVITNA